MDNKETLLNMLRQAKTDYEQSIGISKDLFFKKRRYRKLHTNEGLSDYFYKKFEAPFIADVHLLPFKPTEGKDGFEVGSLWFPKLAFKERLKIINDAITFYSNESNVPQVLIGDSLGLTMKFSAYEKGIIPLDDDIAFMMEYYDEILEMQLG